VSHWGCRQSRPVLIGLALDGDHRAGTVRGAGDPRRSPSNDHHPGAAHVWPWPVFMIKSSGHLSDEHHSRPRPGRHDQTVRPLEVLGFNRWLQHDSKRPQTLITSDGSRTRQPGGEESAGPGPMMAGPGPRSPSGVRWRPRTVPKRGSPPAAPASAARPGYSPGPEPIRTQDRQRSCDTCPALGGVSASGAHPATVNRSPLHW